MTSMTDQHPGVTGGVDTHKDVHVAAALDSLGRELGTRSFAATPAGYAEIVAWLGSFGTIDVVGVEGTGAHGAGLMRHLNAADVAVVEVDRPDRADRRRNGKSDTLDAVAAARAAQSGRASGTPKSRNGRVEAIRTLRVARGGAIKARTAAINQLKAEVRTAPADLREQLRDHPTAALVAACRRLRPTTGTDGAVTGPTAAVKYTLRSIARRLAALEEEIAHLDGQLDRLVPAAAPTLTKLFGVGTDVAGQLLVTAGDNPDRIANEAAFAHLCGVAPIPASSGQRTRWRLNRGGDRQANAAIHRVVLVRLAHNPRTRAYMARRNTDQFGKRDVIRCLKRYVTRELFRALQQDLNTYP